MINITIEPLNFSNVVPYAYGYNPNYPKECFENGQYSIECLYNTICPQLNSYFINTGIAIILIYILMSWLLWWYFKYGYKKFPIPANKFIGDMRNIETRIYWDCWIRARLTTLCIAYIAMVVWLSVNRKI